MVRSAVGKIFKRVVPLFFVMFVANYVDRVNIGFAQDQLRADVGISAAAFGFGAGLFFVAYALFEVPSNMLMERFGAKIWLTRIMITWGLVATAMAFVTSTEMFYALRFLLGVAEAGFFPAVIYYFTRWLPDADRGRATAVFLMGSGTASVIAGPLSGALLEMHGLLGHSGWQWMFFLEGLASVLLGLVVFRFLDNRLEDATWLTAPEKTALAAAIDAEQAARTAERGTAKVSRTRLLTDPQMLLFCWLYFAISLALYAVTFWLPSIVDDIGGLSEFEVGLLVAVPWLCAIAAVYVTGRASDRTGRRRPFLVGTLLLGALGTLLATLVSPWFALVALCLAAMGFKTSSPVFWTIPQSYLDARVAAPAIALVNSLGNLGGFVSPTAFGILQDATGSTRGGLIGLSVVGVLAALSVALVRGGGRNDRPRGRRTATGPAPATVSATAGAGAADPPADAAPGSPAH
ncbi:MFS transporter [Streptomyces sp. Pv4-95]|uniref:MFS transporter n=1 Tax=Streptomyces sp. Pv4-95 TaxID=3049543 RepID=UPI0038922001